MKRIEEEILKRGKILPGNVLKVNSFLNHQLDTKLLCIMADEWYELYKNDNINKIVTIEASGIALATIAGLKFNVPVVFAKKGVNLNADNCFSTTVYSYSKNRDYFISIEKEFLSSDDNVLIIDDFLANASAVLGLISLVKKAKANVVGVGIAIEKGFQPGGAILRRKGYRVESLAIVETMDYESQTIKFR